MISEMGGSDQFALQKSLAPDVRFGAISGCEQVHQIAPIQSTSSLHQFSEDYDCER